jgi:putative Mg2+ transporter-C (MgtC) family protein
MRQLIPWLNLETGRFLSETIVRLVLAAVLGGIIGLERETKRKPAGLRTNMFICFGAAMFTILSFRLAEQYTGDHTRIAAQIIPGIGFIGAGSILHSRGSVTGLTTAATIFVVASIGMATGAGLYLPAIFATVLIVLALHVLGWTETRFSLKSFVVSYQAVGPDAEAIISDVNHILDEEHRVMQTVQVGRTNHDFRVQFTVDATRSDHDDLMQRFRQCKSIARIESEAVSERE